MNAPSQADGVRALAEPLAVQAGLVIENVTITPAGKRRVLRVIVDLPEDRTGGVPMDSVTVAAQAISAALDESSVMGGLPYTRLRDAVLAHPTLAESLNNLFTHFDS